MLVDQEPVGRVGAFLNGRVGKLWPLWLTLLSAVVLLPFLGGSGFWDPYEIKLADAARLVVADGYRLALSAGRPPGLTWIIGFGFSTFGVSEVGGRLPLALLATATVPALYYCGAPFVGRRAALFGGFVLLTSTGFVLGARQLTSNAPALLGAALAVGGIARTLHPSTPNPWRLVHSLAGIVGLLFGLFSAGLLNGVVAPLVAVAMMLWSSRSYAAAGAASAFAFGALGVWLFMLYQQLFMRPTDHVTAQALLGGSPHAAQHAVVYTQHLLKVAMQLFPWSAVLLPAAAVSLSVPQTPPDTPDADARRAPTMILAWLIATWAGNVVQGMLIQDLPTATILPLALGVGLFIDDAISRPSPQPFVGLIILMSGVMVVHDAFAQPDTWLGAHLFEAIRWPGSLTSVAVVLLSVGGFVAGALTIGAGLSLAPQYSAYVERRQRQNRAILFAVAAFGALNLAGLTLYYIVPAASHHLSARDLYGKTKALDPTAPLGQFRFQASSGAYYLGGRTPIDLRSLDEVFIFLAKPERVFVLAGSDELATLDQRSRQTQANFFVIDDTNSRFLVITNRLNSGEVDKNPLRRFVSTTPPRPQHVVEADFEGKIKLLGYDLPATVERGQDFKMRLYFQVLQPVDKQYKLFVHFDGSGARFHGDHPPIEGRLPTTAWTQGSYVTDEHTIVPEKSMQPSGTYQVYAGFWLGDARLKVISGPQDGENRVRLGVLPVK